MKALFIRTLTMIVEQVFAKVPGASYDPPAGCVMVEVPRTTYVDAGFTAARDEAGNWTFTPPAVTEEPEETTLQQQLDDADAKLAEAAAALQAVRARIG